MNAAAREDRRAGILAPREERGGPGGPPRGNVTLTRPSPIKREGERHRFTGTGSVYAVASASWAASAVFFSASLAKSGTSSSP